MSLGSRFVAYGKSACKLNGIASRGLSDTTSIHIACKTALLAALDCWHRWWKVWCDGSETMFWLITILLKISFSISFFSVVYCHLTFIRSQIGGRKSQRNGSSVLKYEAPSPERFPKPSRGFGTRSVEESTWQHLRILSHIFWQFAQNEGT